MSGPEVVITDAKGTEHVFPAGFDPAKAAAIVRGDGAPAPFNPVISGLKKVANFVTNPEVVGAGAAGAAALLTDGLSVPATMAIPALASAGASVGRDLVKGASAGTVAADAAGHALLNAVPGALGWAGGVLAEAGPKAIGLLSKLPGVGAAGRIAQTALGMAGSATEKAIPEVVTKAAADSGGSFLHYLTGTAMVDATPAQRMILAQQRQTIEQLSSDKAAALAAEVAARTHTLAATAAKNAAARITTIQAAIRAGTHAATASASAYADSQGTP